MVSERRAVTLIVQSYNYYLISAVLLCGDQVSLRFADTCSGAFVGHQLLHRDLELGESGASCPSTSLILSRPWHGLSLGRGGGRRAVQWP